MPCPHLVLDGLLRPLHPHLFSMISTGSHAMLEHWVSYYRQLGAPLEHARIVLDNHSAVSASRAAATLTALRVPFTWLEPGERTSELRLTRLKLLNSYMAGLPKGAFVMPADVDEHFSFPCNAVKTLMQRKHKGEVEALCGTMLDRTTVGGRPQSVLPSRSLQEQFPLCAPWRERRFAATGTAVKRAKVTKVTILRVRHAGGVPRFVDAHAARVELVRGGGKTKLVKVGGPDKRNCVDTGYFSHYGFTSAKASIFNGTGFNDLAAAGSGVLSEGALQELRRMSRPCTSYGLDL